MELNISPEFILSTVGSIPLLLSAIVLLLKYIKNRDQILGYLSIGWFLFFLTLFVDGLSYFLMNEFLFKIKFLFILLIGIFTILAVDLMEQQQVRPWSITFAAVVGTFTLIEAFNPENVFVYNGPDGYPSIGSRGLLRYGSLISTLYYASYFFLFSYRLYIASEKHYKPITRVHLIGILIYGPLTFSTFLLGATFAIPGIHALLIGLGAFISSVTLARHPEIMYILPFRVGSLNFVVLGSGLIPFRYVWNPSADLEIDYQLFGSLFEATRQFAKEAFPFGSIEEIVYEKGVVYSAIVKNKDFMILLIADRKSEILKRNLNSFSNIVLNLYEREKINIYNMNQSQQEKIRKLVERNFPFIPKLKD